MASFENASDLVAAIRKDIQLKIFPNFLARLSSGAKAFIEEDLNRVALKVGCKSPAIVLTIQSLPSPGSSVIKIVFTAAEESYGDVRSFKQASAFRRAFKKVHTDKFSSKVRFLKFLGSVGIS